MNIKEQQFQEQVPQVPTSSGDFQIIKYITLGVIASGERNERLKKRGDTINGTQYTPEVWTPEEAKNVDLLIVSLKYGSLRGALDDIQTIVGENTTVMSLMNGVDSEEVISEKKSTDHTHLYSFIKVASQGKEDGYHLIRKQQQESTLRIRRTIRKRTCQSQSTIF